MTCCGLSMCSADTCSPVEFGSWSIGPAAHSCIIAWQLVPALAAERSHSHCRHCAESNLALGACQRTVALHLCLHLTWQPYSVPACSSRGCAACKPRVLQAPAMSAALQTL